MDQHTTQGGDFPEQPASRSVTPGAIPYYASADSASSVKSDPDQLNPAHTPCRVRETPDDASLYCFTVFHGARCFTVPQAFHSAMHPDGEGASTRRVKRRLTRSTRFKVPGTWVCTALTVAILQQRAALLLLRSLKPAQPDLCCRRGPILTRDDILNLPGKRGIGRD
jgi:hypothetical protein